MKKEATAELKSHTSDGGFIKFELGVGNYGESTIIIHSYNSGDKNSPRNNVRVSTSDLVELAKLILAFEEKKS